MKWAFLHAFHLGFEGDNCEVNIDECLNSTCMNNATCIDDINNFTCQCLKGKFDVKCRLLVTFQNRNSMTSVYLRYAVKPPSLW